MRAIVIGTGVIGQATALAVADRGVDVDLVGPRHAGESSATLAAGAMLGAFGEVTTAQDSVARQKETTLRIDAQRRYAAWLETVEGRARRQVTAGCGTFVIANAAGQHDLVNLAEIEAAARAFGAPVERVSPEDVPWLRPTTKLPVLRALHLPEEGFVDAGELIAVLHQATDCHASIQAHPRMARSLDRDHGHTWKVTLENAEQLRANWVVVCAGHGVSRLLQPMRLPRLPKLIAGKGASVTMKGESAPRHVIRTPNREFACGAHVVPRAEGQWYLGATNRLSRTPGLGAGVTGGELHSLLHTGIHEINTSMRTAVVTGMRHGWRPLAVDRYPVVGKLDEGLAVATATYRNGVLMAPVLADWVAETVVTDRDAKDNPFAPLARHVLLPHGPPTPEDVLAEGTKELLAFLVAPHGELPYDRQRELSAFLEGIVQIALGDSDETTRERQRLREALADLPIAEVVADLFYQLADVDRF